MDGIARHDYLLPNRDDTLGVRVNLAIQGGGTAADAKVKEASAAIARLVRS